ncbi:MAG: membrane-bound lytic murein transglycosylase MltF [Limnobacter sp.]|nr:membrane-bound lytic murein transglycosylase MltF [Limnobacter sp.]
MSRIGMVCLGLSIALLGACSKTGGGSVNVSELPKDGEVLKVVTRSGPTTYYVNRFDEPGGPEATLINHLARDNNWTVQWEVVDSTAEVLEALENNEAHMAAAGLTITKERNERLAPGGVYQVVQEQLVCHQKHKNFPRKPEEMVGHDIRVTAKSSYVDTLNRYKQELPGLQFTEEEDHTSEMLLAEVAEDISGCVVADSNIVTKTMRLFPDLRVGFSFPGKRQLGWYMPSESTELAELTQKWLTSQTGKQATKEMQDRHYAYIDDFDFVDMRALNENIEERLPKYRDLFEQAEKETGIPADLLAALAYQESHWNPDAVSPTGVRGIMMLTQNTAQSLGVEDRTDPEEAILAGARYLRDRYDRLPDTIPERDRWFQAMASYNIGRAHVLDVRSFAREMGKNPDSWADLREVLPLKADKRYYPKMRYGYARGYEPVMYVKRIRNYRDVIAMRFDE